MTNNAKIGIVVAAGAAVFGVLYLMRKSSSPDLAEPVKAATGTKAIASRLPAKKKSASSTKAPIDLSTPLDDPYTALQLESAGALGFNSEADAKAWADEDAADIVARIN